MLATYLWFDDVFPLYAILEVDGTDLELSLLRPIALNSTECDTKGTCIYAVATATAQEDLTNDIVSLTNVDIVAELPPEVWEDRDPHNIYTDRLLAVLQDAQLAPNDTEFTLTSALGSTDFVEARSRGQFAVNAYAYMLGLSVRELQTCDVRQLAPLFTRTDLTDGEQVFRNALRGMAHRWALQAQYSALNPFFGEALPESEAQVRALAGAYAIPGFLTGMPNDPDPIEAIWATAGRAMFRDDRAAFDAAIAGYDGTLPALVAFMRHTADSPIPNYGPPQYGDLSMGFIAAQGG